METDLNLLKASMLGAASLVLAFACGRPNHAANDSRASLDRPAESRSANGSHSADAGADVEARRAALLRRIREADPNKATIERAVINDKNELGLVLNRQTNLDDVPKLMKAMLTKMAEEFPGQDLEVIAYTPTEPPRRIGSGHFDVRTRDMTYHPEKP